MKTQTDLDAPIIPGETAAGLQLGISISDIDSNSLAELTHEVKTGGFYDNASTSDIYYSKDIYLRFVGGHLQTIGVMSAYRGTIAQGLGIGAGVSDFEHVYGRLVEGSEDELTFERVNGRLWLEVEETGLNSENWKQVVPSRKVRALYVC
jgi:hypothetical protein